MAINPLEIPYLQGIPTLFDNGTSYLEFLAQVNAKLNEVIESVNDISDDWSALTDEKIREYSVIVNEQLEALRVYTNQQNATMRSELVGLIESDVNILQDQIDGINTNFEYLSNQLVATNNNITVTRDYLLGVISTQNTIQNYNASVEYEKIYDAIDDISKSYPPVHNPTTGKQEPLDKVLNDMYTVLRYNSIQALEFDLRLITAGQFDSLNLTARDFDLNAKTLINYVNEDLTMINGFTGVRDLVKNVVSMIISRMAVARFTVSAFDALTKTASEFDAYHITAYNFDFNGGNVIV